MAISVSQIAFLFQGAWGMYPTGHGLVQFNISKLAFGNRQKKINSQQVYQYNQEKQENMAYRLFSLAGCF